MASRRRGFRDEGGASAIEFAILFPLLIVVLLGGSETIRFVAAANRVDAIADTIAELVAENSSGTVTYADVQFYRDSTILNYPFLLADAAKQKVSWPSSISISMASVDFGAAQQNCGSNCVYVPKMVWSGGTAPRSCLIPMIAADDTSRPAPTTLPAHIYGPGSSIVVDVVYTYKPLLSTQFFSGISIARSSYIAPRFSTLIKYQKVSGDNGIAAACPDYSS